ncbi:MAG: phosphatidate cytidylyltransferase [Planctomycetota bacterium]
MNDAVRDRLFSVSAALSDRHAIALAGAVAAMLLVGSIGVAVFGRGPSKRELWRRVGTWVVIALILVPSVLLGAVTTTLLVLVVSAWCFREYARTTGLFREPVVTLIVYVSLVTMAFGALDNRFALFAATPMTSAILISVSAVIRDQPNGYLQRVAVGVFGLMLVGAGPAHLSMFTIDERFRSILLVVLTSVAVSDVSAYIVGRACGRKKLAPNTSPGKTVAGSIGSLVITASYAAVNAWIIWDNGLGIVGSLGFGVLVAGAAQIGDLVMSSIKRDIGIKDFGTLLPGHGGLLDRVDSLLLAAPVAFYYIAYLVGVGNGAAERVLTGE